MRHICNMYFSSSIIADFLEYLTIQEIDAQPLFARFTSLQQRKYITYEEIADSLLLLKKELNDDQLGLHIGEQISLKVTAYVDSIMEYSDSLELAFENAAKYSKMISDALQTSLHKSANFYSVRFEENPNWTVYPSYVKQQISNLTLLACLKSLVAYTNNKYYPVKIHFETPKPKSLREYYRIFNCSVHFNQPQTEIFFEKQIFDKYTKDPQFGLLQSLQEKAALEMLQLKSENELIQRLKKTILSYKPEKIKQETAARELNLSTRTLQRKLKELNTTYKEVENELLLRLSKTYLEESECSIEEISYLLGFSESSAFIRFFKSLTETTPKKYCNE